MNSTTNNITTTSTTTVSPTLTCNNLLQQFTTNNNNNNNSTTDNLSNTVITSSTSTINNNNLSNLNAAVIAAAQQFLPKINANNLSSLFTVEQLELIRRLKMTGISADAVLEAFNTLEKIDTDFGANNVQSFALSALMGTSPKLFSSDTNTDISKLNKTIQTPGISASSSSLLQQLSTQNFGNNTTGMPPLSTPLSQINGFDVPKTPPNLSPENKFCMTTPTSLPFSSTNGPDVSFLFPNLNSQLNPTTTNHNSSSSSSSPSTSLHNNGGRPIRSQRTPMKEITTLDDPNELEEFMSQGEEACINDMKQFITQFSLRQTTVAMMTGVSQPYISKLLNGNHRELSLRCRKNIYSWYLNCRRHPSKLAVFLQDPSTRLETNGDGELIPQRRERYVFRPILIKILENFFAEMPFPDYTKRVEIATACNNALQLDKKGTALMAKEIVSPQVVSNWFANKRKELRRKSNEDSTLPTTNMNLFQQQQFANSFNLSMSSNNSIDDNNTSPINSINNSPLNLNSELLENNSTTISTTNTSTIGTTLNSIDIFNQQQLENYKNVLNINNLYNLKHHLSTTSTNSNNSNENVNIIESTSSSPIEFDKNSNNFLQNLINAYQQGSQLVNLNKIEQTAE